jgi:hypothetical protein
MRERKKKNVYAETKGPETALDQGAVHLSGRADDRLVFGGGAGYFLMDFLREQ